MGQENGIFFVTYHVLYTGGKTNSPRECTNVFAIIASVRLFGRGAFLSDHPRVCTFLHKLDTWVLLESFVTIGGLYASFKVTRWIIGVRFRPLSKAAFREEDRKSLSVCIFCCCKDILVPTGKGSVKIWGWLCGEPRNTQARQVGINTKPVVCYFLFVYTTHC